MNSTSPLEYLAAFGIAFLGGVVATVGIQQYTKRVRKNEKAKNEKENSNGKRVSNKAVAA